MKPTAAQIAALNLADRDAIRYYYYYYYGGWYTIPGEVGTGNQHATVPRGIGYVNVPHDHGMRHARLARRGANVHVRRHLRKALAHHRRRSCRPGSVSDCLRTRRLRRKGGISSMKITSASHLDHGLTADQIEYIKTLFAERDQFFIETFTLPQSLGTVPCGLYGPLVGDAPVTDARDEHRGSRAYTSRVVDCPKRFVSDVTVIAGPHGR